MRGFKLKKLTGFPAECKMCGHCCVQTKVILSPFDIFAIAVHLKTSAARLFTEKILTYSINTTTYWMEPVINNKNDKEICPFLMRQQDKYLCRLYNNRPFVCRISPLAYSCENNAFFRSAIAEKRCYPYQPLTVISVSRYLKKNNSKKAVKKNYKYRLLLKKIIDKGYTLKKIVNKPAAKKNFFRIQQLLYETCPADPLTEKKYPFKKIKKYINSFPAVTQ
ncbi:MAG TPA: YkgJ family cysteine cluster protein [Spirochaetota bacterium]|nr:YkgJ family cysteine cluster protein [Spirochaetota bacterium]